MNEIMFFFLSILSVCGSAFIQGFLTLAEAGQRSTFTFILFPPFKEKKTSLFFSPHIPACLIWRWCENRIVEMVARSGQPAI